MQQYLMDMLQQLIVDVKAESSHRIESLTKSIAHRGKLYEDAFGGNEYLKKACKLLIIEADVMMDWSHVPKIAYDAFTGKQPTNEAKDYINSLLEQDPK